MRGWRVWLQGAALALWAVGAGAGGLDIREGYVRELPPGQTTSAAFMRLVNSGVKPVTIVSASSSVAARAEIHATRQRDGLMRMAPVGRVPVPAHGDVALAPGGYHLMLIDLKRPLKAGDQVDVTLRDDQGGVYSVNLPVLKILGVGGGVSAQAEHTH